MKMNPTRNQVTIVRVTHLQIKRVQQIQLTNQR